MNDSKAGPQARRHEAGEVWGGHGLWFERSTARRSLGGGRGTRLEHMNMTRRAHTTLTPHHTACTHHATHHAHAPCTRHTAYTRVCIYTRHVYPMHARTLTSLFRSTPPAASSSMASSHSSRSKGSSDESRHRSLDTCIYAWVVHAGVHMVCTHRTVYACMCME